MHTAQEIGIDHFQASRASDQKFYRTTPRRGLFVREKGGFYHDGQFADLNQVIAHYSRVLDLALSDSGRANLVQFLKSLWAEPATPRRCWHHHCGRTGERIRVEHAPRVGWGFAADARPQEAGEHENSSSRRRILAALVEHVLLDQLRRCYTAECSISPYDRKHPSSHTR